MPEPANAGVRSPPVVSRPLPDCCVPGATRARAHPALVAVHSVGLGVQALLLGWIAAPAGGSPLLVASVFAAFAVLVTLALTRPVFAGPWLSMLTFGGLGMTAGWWVDLGAPGPIAAATRFVADSAWCRSPELTVHSLGHVHLVSWMNAGMLLFGLPAMRIGGVRDGVRDARGLVQRGVALALCSVAMVAGMMASAVVIDLLLRGLAPGVTPSRILLWLGMTGGMLAGMATSHRVLR